MNIIPASEVKRRGVAVLEENLKKGPLHIVKNNRLTCVVLSEEDYASLVGKGVQSTELSLLDLLDQRPWSGSRSKTDIKKQIKEERKSWSK